MVSKVNKQKSPDTRYIPVSQFDQYHPWPTPQSIRNRIHKASRGIDPGFLNCIKRAGGRVLVDEQAFLTWLEAQSATEAE